MKEDVLIDLGFSKNETKVYLSLIRLGPSTAGAIAAKANIHRTNVYDALERLCEKGFVGYIFKGHKKFFDAVNPEELMEVLNEKVRNFEALLPSLQLDYKLSKGKSKAYIFEGIQGIKTITNDMLKEGKEIMVFGIPKDVSKILKSFIEVFHKRRIEKKIWMYHLYDADARDRIARLNSLEYTQAKYVPQNFKSPATTLVYGDKVAFNIWSDPPFGILIESKGMADQYRQYFGYIYKNAKSL